MPITIIDSPKVTTKRLCAGIVREFEKALPTSVGTAFDFDLHYPRDRSGYTRYDMPPTGYTIFRVGLERVEVGCLWWKTHTTRAVRNTVALLQFAECRVPTIRLLDKQFVDQLKTALVGLNIPNATIEILDEAEI